MAEQDVDEMFERKIVGPLTVKLTDALERGQEYFDNRIKDLVYKGWYDYRRSGRVDQLLSNIFENFLRGQVKGLIKLAKRDPEGFNAKIGLIKANYWLVTEKLIDLLIQGGRFTSRFGLPYDAGDKEHTLLYLHWTSMYLTLKARLSECRKSIGQEWGFVVVELRCRELADRRKNCTTWLKSCPFATDFGEAFDIYSLKKVKELMELEDPNWFI